MESPRTNVQNVEIVEKLKQIPNENILKHPLVVHKEDDKDNQCWILGNHSGWQETSEENGWGWQDASGQPVPNGRNGDMWHRSWRPCPILFGIASFMRRSGFVGIFFNTNTFRWLAAIHFLSNSIRTPRWNWNLRVETVVGWVSFGKVLCFGIVQPLHPCTVWKKSAVWSCLGVCMLPMMTTASVWGNKCEVEGKCMSVAF